jgi:hypothetical protein
MKAGQMNAGKKGGGSLINRKVSPFWMKDQGTLAAPKKGARHHRKRRSKK